MTMNGSRRTLLESSLDTTAYDMLMLHARTAQQVQTDPTKSERWGHVCRIILDHVRHLLGKPPPAIRHRHRHRPTGGVRQTRSNGVPRGWSRCTRTNSSSSSSNRRSTSTSSNRTSSTTTTNTSSRRRCGNFINPRQMNASKATHSNSKMSWLVTASARTVFANGVINWSARMRANTLKFVLGTKILPSPHGCRASQLASHV